MAFLDSSVFIVAFLTCVGYNFIRLEFCTHVMGAIQSGPLVCSQLHPNTTCFFSIAGPYFSEEHSSLRKVRISKVSF